MTNKGAKSWTIIILWGSEVEARERKGVGGTKHRKLKQVYGYRELTIGHSWRKHRRTSDQ